MLGLLAASLLGCGSSLPSHVMRQSNAVQQGVVIGVRRVAAKAPAMAAIGHVMGFLTEHAAVDAAAFEYIVRKPNDDLVSVTQSDSIPLALWQNVRVFGGNRARVVPDDSASGEKFALRSRVGLAEAPVEETTPAPAVALQP